jgi:hypothetical protein
LAPASGHPPRDRLGCHDLLAKREFLETLTRLTLHKIINYGEGHHVGSLIGQATQLLTPDIGSVSRDVFRRSNFLENKDFAVGRISVENPNGGQNGGQTHS